MDKLLYLIVFLCGALIMILELTGSRILAPHVGGSLPVWTSLIGIILGSLSLGYVLGGRLADREASYTRLGLILALASVFTGLIPVLGELMLPAIIAAFQDVRVSAVISSFLFVPSSIVLGMVSPYAVRLKLKTVKTSGQIVGRLYALSTIGSIAGTFLTGFYLLAVLSSEAIIYLITASLITLSLIPFLTQGKKISKELLAIILIIIAALLLDLSSNNKKGKEINTLYSRVTILDYNLAGSPVREMVVGTNRMSAMFLKKDDLVYEYTKYYRLGDHFSNPRKTLMIGGAGYSYPKEYLERHPKGTIDVVEIDSGLTKIAMEHFSLKEDPRLGIYHEDARTYLNRNQKKYDAIYMDAFASSHAIPFQLTTKEFVQKMYDSLNEQGVIIANTISAVEGDKGKFLRAEYHTYKSVFPYVEVYPVYNRHDGKNVQNMILVAFKKPTELTSENEELQRLLSHRWTGVIKNDMPILRDSLAPVEQYELSILN